MNISTSFPENYVLECTADGGYYAYLSDYDQCCAYGETEDDALENLKDVADEYFKEIALLYTIEDVS